jgi:hypothetical protein
MVMKKRLIARLLAACLSSAALAQTPSVTVSKDSAQRDTATVIADAPIYLYPDTARQPLRIVETGSRLDLLEQKGEWCTVVFDDPQYGTRQGYIQSKYVTIQTARRPPASSEPTSAAPAKSTPGAPISSPTSDEAWRLPDSAIQHAIAIGESGNVKAVIVTCMSANLKESFRASAAPLVFMRISGPIGDIATQAYEQKRLYKPIEIPDTMKAWHVTVLAEPQAIGIVQNIVLKSSTGTATPEKFVQEPSIEGRIGALALFTDETAKMIVQGGEFQVTAVLSAGERSCKVKTDDRKRIGL